MRVLVTGGTGLLGWWIAGRLASAGYDVVATYHSNKPTPISNVEWRRLDITSPESVSTTIADVKPDIVIHSAAYTDVDGCQENKRKAIATNYLGTTWVARSVAKRGARLIYISTDYVFDGSRGNYKEDDEPNPVNYYGLTKLLGEAAIRAKERSLVVRVSGLYGYSPTGKKNFAVKVVDTLVSGGTVKAFYDQFLSPTYAPALAGLLVRAIEKSLEGVIHIAGSRLSRYEQALLIASILGAPRDRVVPVSLGDLALPAPRPKDSSLDTSKAGSLGIVHPSHEESTKEFVSYYLSVRESGVGGIGDS